jgi:LPS-assembly protein
VTLPGEVQGTESLSDLLLGAGFNWTQRWAFDSTVQYNQDTNRSTRSTVSARYSPGPYRTISMATACSGAPANRWMWAGSGRSTPAGGLHPASTPQPAGRGRWYTVGRMNYSMQDNKLVDTVVGFEYDSCCWIGRVVLERLNSIRSSATKLMFQIEFVGFSRLSLGNDPLQPQRPDSALPRPA